MRLIRNKTLRPVRVPLPKGKVLHLGPHKEGQIATHDIDHAPVLALVEAGDIEILEAGSTPEGATTTAGGHVDIHGHHPRDSVKKRGNR